VVETSHQPGRKETAVRSARYKGPNAPTPHHNMTDIKKPKSLQKIKTGAS